MQPVLAPDVLAVAGIVVLALVCGLIWFTHPGDRPTASRDPAGACTAARGAATAEHQAKT